MLVPPNENPDAVTLPVILPLIEPVIWFIDAEKAVNEARIAANTPAPADTEEVAADNGADSEE